MIKHNETSLIPRSHHLSLMILVTFLVLKTAFFLHPFPEWFFLQLTSHGQNSVAILTCCHDLFGCKERYKALLPVSHSKLRQAALWQVGLALYFHANTNEVVLLWKWEGCLKCGDVLVGFFFFLVRVILRRLMFLINQFNVH